MKTRKYFVRFINIDKTLICTSDDLLAIIINYGNWPLRVVPLDSNGNLVYELDFLVGDDYSLSFLFNNKDI